MVSCTRFNIIWSSLSVTCGMSVVSPTNKTDHLDVTEILLKVMLNTISPNFRGKLSSNKLFSVFNKLLVLWMISRPVGNKLSKLVRPAEMQVY